ncbi:RAQPRD family integrative conjugative element protein [Legionella yabuuchiae]|uniref:RAQPRD family integrative conjugative element protein n=1 Tax=Legionella yabuuchiae TaxID=376727 RepID=UPI001054BEFC|nr:RAQPRD family integrative conjugative element protein [Legionella yabuuchiae]
MKQIFTATIFFLSLTAQASNPNLNETLVRIINQINAITPLLDEAQSELNPKARIQLHIESFNDNEGHHHVGVREDLLMIRNGLIDYINEPVVSPRKVKPLNRDFVRKP